MCLSYSMGMLQALILVTLAYLMGIPTGFYLRDFVVKRTKDEQFTSKNLVLVIVVAVWAISMLVDIAIPDYETNYFLYSLMGAVVGFFFNPIKFKNDN